MTTNSNQPPSIVTVSAGDSRASVNYIETLLDDRGQSHFLRKTLIGIVLLTLVLISWAFVAEVEELARARGEIQPSGRVQILQSQEGGTIVMLYVEEGDSVVAGQLIADFSTTDLMKLQKQTQIKLNSLAIDRERMQAILEDRKPDFTAFANDYPELVAQAKITYREAMQSRASALEAKRSAGGQQGSLLAGAVQDEKLVLNEIKEARQRLQRLEEGAKRGVVTQLSLSEARQQLISLQERLSEVRARAAGMRSSVQGADAEVSRLEAELNENLSIEMSKITEQYSELKAEMKALEERQGRVELISPVDGIVMDLPQTSVGAVIPPGGTVAEIVPSGEDIVMEVMVMPRDIGFVKEGQRASVKIDSFDSARFGSVTGKVARVAPTSSKMKENGMPFYKVEVALDTNFVGSELHRLIPGMTGEADIATGQKSVIQYLLKPIFLASDTAFHER